MCSRSSIGANLNIDTLCCNVQSFAAGFRCEPTKRLMVGTLPRRHSSRHRRAAAILALRAIRNTSPVRPAERRAERRRLRRDRARCCDAAFYRGLLAFCEAPPEKPRRRRRAELLPPVVEGAIIVSSDTSAEDIVAPNLTPPVVVDLDSSLETLPDIDPRPQFQLPVDPCKTWDTST